MVEAVVVEAVVVEAVVVEAVVVEVCGEAAQGPGSGHSRPPT